VFLINKISLKIIVFRVKTHEIYDCDKYWPLVKIWEFGVFFCISSIIKKIMGFLKECNNIREEDMNWQTSESLNQLCVGIIHANCYTVFFWPCQEQKAAQRAGKLSPRPPAMRACVSSTAGQQQAGTGSNAEPIRWEKRDDTDLFESLVPCSLSRLLSLTEIFLFLYFSGAV